MFKSETNHISGGSFFNFEKFAFKLTRRIVIGFVASIAAIFFIVTFALHTTLPIREREIFVNFENAFGTSTPSDPLGFLKPYVAEDVASRYQEEPARCHPGTRELILASLEAQLEPINSSAFVWVHGPPGFGKTAVMRNLSERFDSKNQLLASFFFPPGQDDYTPSTDHDWRRTFIPTLAYHLCQAIPELRAPILKTWTDFRPIPLLDKIEDQAQKLLIGPIQTLVKSSEGFPERTTPQVIVVDGPDDFKPQVIRTLNLLSETYPFPLLIFFTSRPDPETRAYFESSPLLEKTTQYGIYEDPQADADIRKYLTDKFDELKQKHRFRKRLPIDHGRWPSSEILDTLVEQASGHFLFAALVMQVVGHPRGDPDHRLKVLLEHLRPHPSGGDSEPSRHLDNLYRVVFSTVQPSQLQDVLDVLAVGIVNRGIISDGDALGAADLGVLWDRWATPPLESLGILLANHTTYCGDLAAKVHALIALHPLYNGEPSLPKYSPQPPHTSLAAFLRSESRAGPVLFISPERAWECVVMASIRHRFWHEGTGETQVTFLGLRFAEKDLAERDLDGNTRPIAPRLLALLRTPEFVDYDYAEMSTSPRLAGERSLKQIWVWLSCVTSFLALLDKLRFAGFQDIYTSHQQSFDAYLKSSLSVYASNPELWFLMAMSVWDSPPAESYWFDDFRPELTGAFVEALSSSPELLNSDRAQGFAFTQGPNTTLGYGLSRWQHTPALKQPLQRIRNFAFGPGKKTWYSIINDFAELSVRRGQVSASVAQFVFSEGSFDLGDSEVKHYESESEPKFGRWEVDVQIIQMFLENFPNHLDDERRVAIQHMINMAWRSRLEGHLTTAASPVVVEGHTAVVSRVVPDSTFTAVASVVPGSCITTTVTVHVTTTVHSVAHDAPTTAVVSVLPESCITMTPTVVCDCSVTMNTIVVLFISICLLTSFRVVV